MSEVENERIYTDGPGHTSQCDRRSVARPQGAGPDHPGQAPTRSQDPQPGYEKVTMTH